jgi:UDPglucose 6-dehydrogenase
VGIEKGNVFFICVGTPPLENGDADLAAIESVARDIAQHAEGYCVVIEKSTVPVQTAQRLRRHLSIYRSSNLEYDVVSNPEFLREGSAVEDFFHPARIVVGVESDRATRCMEEIYKLLLGGTVACPLHSTCPISSRPRFLITDTSSAELVKHASNSFLAMKISFSNMVADLCEIVGADVESVMEGIGLDPRIGASFLRPGIGFGGFCFPKDLQAFVRIAEKFGCDFSLLKEVEKINKRRIEEFVLKLERELWVTRGKRVAVWGLSFKPNTDDIRFAPSLAIIRRLLAQGAEVRAYDPKAMPKSKIEVPELQCCSDPYAAANGADAVLILTEWEEFSAVDWKRVHRLMERPLVVDGRNMFSPEKLQAEGFDYIAIGRAPVYRIGTRIADVGDRPSETTITPLPLRA